MSLHALNNGDILFNHADSLILIPKSVIDEIQSRNHPDSSEHLLRLYEPERALPFIARTLEQNIQQGGKVTREELSYWSKETGIDLAKNLAVADLGEAIGCSNPWSICYSYHGRPFGERFGKVESGIFAGCFTTPALDAHVHTVGVIGNEPVFASHLYSTHFTVQVRPNTDTEAAIHPGWRAAQQELGFSDAIIERAATVVTAYPGKCPVLTPEVIASKYGQQHAVVAQMPGHHEAFGINNPLRPLPASADEYYQWFMRELQHWQEQQVPDPGDGVHMFYRYKTNPRQEEQYALKLQDMIDYTKSHSEKFSPREHAPYPNVLGGEMHNPRYGFIQGKEMHGNNRNVFTVSFLSVDTNQKEYELISAFLITLSMEEGRLKFEPRPIEEGLREISSVLFGELIDPARQQRDADQLMVEALNQPQSFSHLDHGGRQPAISGINLSSTVETKPLNEPVIERN